MIVGGTYLSITGNWSWTLAAFGAVYALGHTTVLFGKHTDKLTKDRKKRIHTLPVILVEAKARAVAIGMLIPQPIPVTVLVATQYLKWPMLVVLLGIPSISTAVRIFSKVRPTKKT